MKLFLACLALSASSLGQAPTAYAQVQECPEEGCETDPIAQDRTTKNAQKKNQDAGISNVKGPATKGMVSEASARPEPIPIIQDYEPNPAIWKLSDGDTTIYMFGTFHILPERFRWRSAAFDSIVGEVDELVVETSDVDSGASVEKFVFKLVAKSLAGDALTVSERLSEGNREKWFSIADESGMPRTFFDKMPPLLSLMGVGISVAEKQGSHSEFGVETVLEAEFKATERPIGSIEDSQKVMEALLGIDENLLIEDLDAELTKWDGKGFDTLFADDDEATAGDEVTEKITEKSPFEQEHAWAQGIAGKLSIDDFADTEFGQQMHRVLLIDRNRAWAEWLENRLEVPGTILLAVGAGHFEGAHSVQVMLTERGLTAERLH